MTPSYDVICNLTNVDEGISLVCAHTYHHIYRYVQVAEVDPVHTYYPFNSALQPARKCVLALQPAKTAPSPSALQLEALEHRKLRSVSC